MPKLPRISGVEALRALERLGFEKVRQRIREPVRDVDRIGAVERSCVILR
jgi:hypothetical protein